ncbi:ClC family H(+)/Cl(-) exchange transporter [Lachnoclostridium sp. An169]|uniref:ClC family H(+)/Cl(-) exchange transporter n=1 Tax=Lachnoclostridium sp. An169 TaxID=1965569 RepID=UPI000B381296|nr:ClC family H(+)/Cl(-) exchange transporter [Lachnoclostridium sp. An169]OUP82798.1 ClC family H(+)/Cl(-) exchange transporter [Lachnoclostridium sp. An169]
MKKDTSHTLDRVRRLPVLLIGEGLLVGAAAGLVVLLYRVALTFAGQWLKSVLAFISGHPLRIAGWFLVLFVLALIVGRLVKWEPMISGSGIPQIEGEIMGKLSENWKKVLPAKFLGGFLCILGGLSLGREGPSIQLGAMTGQGISRLLDRGKTEENHLMTCGASAGLAAAFHAPLAGMMFSLEEIHKGFSTSILISVMTASVTADYICSHIIGLDPVFQFRLEHVLPQNYYWLLVILGIILGVMGALYNKGMLAAQDLYKKPKFLTGTGRLVIAFMTAGGLGLVMPSVLGSGNDLIVSLTGGEMLLGGLIVTFVVKFLFSAVSFGSGAPGGIFFPLLILGALIGGIFSMTGTALFGLDPVYMNNFVLLSMAGFFTAIVRAPITGIILLFEMSGSVSQMLSLAIVSVAAYITAHLLKSEPIYESLLGRILSGKKEDGRDGGAADGSGDEEGARRENVTGREKVLSEFVIMSGSVLEGKKVSDITWPKNCLLVAVERDGKELIPRGRTGLMAGDKLTVITDVRDAGYVHDKLENLCYTSF